MRGFDTDISTQAYRVNGFSHGYSTSPNALAMDGRGDSALSGLIIILGPHSQGVALGYLIPPLWSEDRFTSTSLIKPYPNTILITSLLFYLSRALERNLITWIPEVGAIGIMQQV